MVPGTFDTPAVVRSPVAPTGRLTLRTAHIVALNSALVQASNGKMLLCINDLGDARSTSLLVDPILNSLSWLGCDWQGEVIYQSRRVAIYEEFVQELLATGRAYRCFCRPAGHSIDSDRAEGELSSFQCSRNCRSLPDLEVQSRLQGGAQFRALLYAPSNVIQYLDMLRGPLSVAYDAAVLLSENDLPSAAMAEAVDDHEFGVTHVIRDHDHLSRTIKQIQICKAFGWESPRIGHVSKMIFSDDLTKSSQPGERSVDEYRQEGILGEALRYYLSTLDETAFDAKSILPELQLSEQMAEENEARSSVVFDDEKLAAINKAQLMAKTDHELAVLVAPLLVDSGVTTKYWLETRWTYLRSVIGLLKERASRLTDFVELGGYFFYFDFKHQLGTEDAHFSAESVHLLEITRERLTNLESFSGQAASRVLAEVAGEAGVEKVRLELWTRLAVSGKVAGPELAQVLELLSQPIVVERVKKAIDYLRSKHKL